MVGQITLQPQVLNLALYAGDGVEIKFNCKNSNGAPINITGSIKAQVRLSHHAPDPPIVEFAAEMANAFNGVVILTLTGSQTETLSNDPSSKSGKFTGVWDVQWTPAGKQPRTLCQGAVECVADVTH